MIHHLWGGKRAGPTPEDPGGAHPAANRALLFADGRALRRAKPASSAFAAAPGMAGDGAARLTTLPE